MHCLLSAIGFTICGTMVEIAHIIAYIALEKSESADVVVK